MMRWFAWAVVAAVARPGAASTASGATRSTGTTSARPRPRGDDRERSARPDALVLADDPVENEELAQDEVIGRDSADELRTAYLGAVRDELLGATERDCEDLVTARLAGSAVCRRR